MPAFSTEAMTELATKIFESVGVPGADASIVSRNLVDANLRGHDSHGVMRIPQYVGFLRNGDYRIDVPLAVETDSPAIVVCDANWGLGQVQAHRLLDLIIPRCRTLGLAAGTARNCGHIGRLGEYAERASAEGLILIATVNNDGAGQRVAPPGGIQGRLGTNPLCVSVPTEQVDEPLVLDFGTSVVAEGKVRRYYINGKEPVPDGWLLDAKGEPTNDPSVLYEPPLGSILPMGASQAYKGFGLGLVLDLLSGGLSGGNASYPGAPPARGNNVFFLVLDPAKFAGVETLTAQSSRLASYVRETPRRAGVEAVLLPGEPERRVLEVRSARGIPLENAHWAKLTELAQELQIALPEPLPES
ncbi:Ldh family oxidoreductase [Singulisphaera sp. PoT]|uniref:Ldh family oxidoreductase n=1 Tax=Singulisphaera sp. PoT TaxID=3411797 RepID=UPI003BF5392D